MSQACLIESYDGVIVLHPKAEEFEHHDERFLHSHNGAWITTDAHRTVRIQQGGIFVESRCSVDWKDPLDECVGGFDNVEVHLIVHVFNCHHRHVGMYVHLPTPFVKVSTAHVRKKTVYRKKKCRFRTLRRLPNTLLRATTDTSLCEP